MKHCKFGLAAAVVAGALSMAAAMPSNAQTLTIGVRAGPESIDPHFTATGTHAFLYYTTTGDPSDRNDRNHIGGCCVRCSLGQN